MNASLNFRGRTRIAVAWALAVIWTGTLHSQPDTISVPDFFAGGQSLDRVVRSVAAQGRLSETVFLLSRYGRYLLDSTVVVPAGQRLTIIGPEPGSTQETAPAQVIWSPAQNLDVNHNFRCFGDIALKNIWLLYADTDGRRRPSSLQIEDSPDTVNGQVAVFDGVIFDYSKLPNNGSGAVGVAARHFRGTFRNCYFRNCIDEQYRYYGRAVSYPQNVSGWHTDSLTFEHCTFANIGYVLEQESENYADFVRMNHCTFVNTMMFALESGWWRRISVTNSVFFNVFMYGSFPAFDRFGSPHPGGALAIDSVASFGFPVPFADADRQILFSHSSYTVEDWIREWMASIEPIWIPDSTVPEEERKPHALPMFNATTLNFFDLRVDGTKAFPLMNRASLYDSTDPEFVYAPTDQPAIKRYLWIRWHTSEDTSWAFYPEDAIYQHWPLRESLAYMNDTLLTAGMGGFPLGDLYRWFPDRYSDWKIQAGQEYERIDEWLDTGIDPEDPSDVNRSESIVPEIFVLSQNYPNPFNPTTRISYSVPGRHRIILKVYNLLGQEIATLFDGTKDAGNHAHIFDGRNLASGMYLYRLIAGDFVATKRFVLLR